MTLRRPLTTHNASGGPSIACNANRTSPACVAAITDALKAVEYLRDPANPMDPSSMVAGGYADLEMRLVNGAFGGLSNQDLAAVVYAERLRTIELLTRYPDSVQAALKGFVNQSIVNAAIAVLTFGIAEKIGATGPKGNAGQTSGEATNNQNGTTSGTSAASNANAQAALKAELSGLQKAQQSAVVTKTPPDGRVRYYTQEVQARTDGPTRGASFVTEYNPSTGSTRQWMESYDHSGKVIRVHPKSIDGRPVNAQHYPPTGAELEGWK